MPEDKKTVLIVDDEADARDFVEAVVSQIGDLNILTASDGKSAVQKAQAELPDLVISDVMMPGQDGFHAFHELSQNEKTANIPVIMVTGVSKRTGMKFSGKDMAEYLGAEPAAFLEKPVDPMKLMETVKQVLGI